MTGDAVTPTHRHGEDGSLREDGLLECQLLTETIDWQKLQNNTLEILKKKTGRDRSCTGGKKSASTSGQISLGILSC